MLPSVMCYRQTFLQKYKSTHLFGKSSTIQSLLACSDPVRCAAGVRSRSHPPHNPVQTAQCYRCTDKWKEGGVALHEINKRGRERRRRGAPQSSIQFCSHSCFSPFFPQTYFLLIFFVLFKNCFSSFFIFFFSVSKVRDFHLFVLFSSLFSSSLSNFLPFLSFHS